MRRAVGQKGSVLSRQRINLCNHLAAAAVLDPKYLRFRGTVLVCNSGIGADDSLLLPCVILGVDDKEGSRNKGSRVGSKHTLKPVGLSIRFEAILVHGGCNVPCPEAPGHSPRKQIHIGVTIRVEAEHCIDDCQGLGCGWHHDSNVVSVEPEV